MRKNMTAVAALAAATVLAFGIAACGNGGSSDTSSGGTSATAQGGNGEKKMEVADVSKESFVSTTKYADSGLPPSVQEQDKKGNLKITTEVPNQGKTEIYYVDKKFYRCDNGPCTEDATLNEAAADTDMVKQFQDQLQQAKDAAKYLGEESCSAGTCETWEMGGQKYFLDKDHRLSRVTASATNPYTNEPTEMTTEVEYKDVPEIKVPQM